MPNMLPVGGCDHAVSATTRQALLVLTFAVSGAALNQSRSASGVYTGLTSEMPRKDTGYALYYRHFVTVTKTHGTRCVFEYRRHAADTPKHLVRAWPDTRTLLRLSVARELSGCFDVREGQRQRRLNRWLRSLRDHNHLARWGSLQPVKGSLAPLTRP